MSGNTGGTGVMERAEAPSATIGAPAEQEGSGTTRGPSVSDVPVDVGAELERTRRALGALTREREVTRELFALGALDLDICAALLEREVERSPGTSIASLAGALRKRRPGLFRQGAGGLESLRPPAAAAATPGSESNRPRSDTPNVSASSRGALLRYMRVRRDAAD